MAVFLLFDGQGKAATLLKFMLTTFLKYNGHIKNVYLTKYKYYYYERLSLIRFLIITPLNDVG
ncbi:hypothetical protein [Psychrobacter sp. PAMC 21119]|uniref:hypothetical protein n=1 Tax=Psychrobacter sp. PAMC 21119 TaxID=1112209 RepID=UPI00028A3ECE|nr:hypothetical protein [Psychrobacter sp. PAMC 21119]